MLAKINVPADAEVGLVAATAGAAHGDGKSNRIQIPSRNFICPISRSPRWFNW